MKNIYLVGMMGCGKSTTGRELAKLLHCSFVDVDRVIEESEGMLIKDIFKEKGERHFRSVECKALAAEASKAAHVIATGGGAVLDTGNRKIMSDTGRVIYLKTSQDTLWDRVKRNVKRPLLATENPREALDNLFHNRESLYEALAEVVALTDGKSPAEVAQEIYQTSLKEK